MIDHKNEVPSIIVLKLLGCTITVWLIDRKVLSRAHRLGLYKLGTWFKSSVDYQIENKIKWHKKFASKLQKSTWPPSKYIFPQKIFGIFSSEHIIMIILASSWTPRFPSSPSQSSSMLPSLVTANAKPHMIGWQQNRFTDYFRFLESKNKEFVSSKSVVVFSWSKNITTGNQSSFCIFLSIV